MFRLAAPPRSECVAERHGYNGPIRLSIPNLPEDFIFAGGNIVAEVNNTALKRQPNTTGYVTLTAKPDAKPRTLELSVWGEGGPPEHPIRRRAVGPGLIFTVKGEEIINLTGDATPTRPAIYPWLGIELPLALGASSARRAPGQPTAIFAPCREWISPLLPDRQARCGNGYGKCGRAHPARSQGVDPQE